MLDSIFSNPKNSRPAENRISLPRREGPSQDPDRQRDRPGTRSVAKDSRNTQITPRDLPQKRGAGRARKAALRATMACHITDSAAITKIFCAKGNVRKRDIPISSLFREADTKIFRRPSRRQRSRNSGTMKKTPSRRLIDKPVPNREQRTIIARTDKDVPIRRNTLHGSHFPCRHTPDCVPGRAR